MNDLSSETLSDIKKAKGQARYTSYFWIIVLWCSALSLNNFDYYYLIK